MFVLRRGSLSNSLVHAFILFESHDTSLQQNSFKKTRPSAKEPQHRDSYLDIMHKLLACPVPSKEITYDTGDRSKITSSKFQQLNLRTLVIRTLGPTCQVYETLVNSFSGIKKP